MRLLLDECVPRPLRREFTEWGVRTAGDMGWTGIKNGALLALAATQFDALLTVDVGLDVSLAQTGAQIRVVLIRARGTDLRLLVPHVPAAKAAFARLAPGEFAAVGG